MPSTETTLKPTTLRFAYGVAYSKKGAFTCTFCYGAPEEDGSLFVTYAKCSPKDTFVKSQGRSLAALRYVDEDSAHSFYVNPKDAIKHLDLDSYINEKAQDEFTLKALKHKAIAEVIQCQFKEINPEIIAIYSRLSLL